MIIGDRLRVLREQKNLSQGDIEKRTGLLRCYVSRVENGHTIPSIETLEKMARALELPLYQLVYDGNEPPVVDLPTPRGRSRGRDDWGASGKDARFLRKLRNLLGKMNAADRELLLFTVQRMVHRHKPQRQAAAQERAEEQKEAAAAATAS